MKIPVSIRAEAAVVPSSRVAIYRRWRGKIPLDREGRPIPRNLWPRRRPHTWRVRWFATRPDGTVVRPARSFENREEAEEFRAAKQAELDARPEARRMPANITLRDFADEFLGRRIGSRGRRIQDKTVANYDAAFRRFIGFVGGDRVLKSIGRRNCIDFCASLHEASEGRGNGRPMPRLAVATINKEKALLKAAFNVAVDPLGYIRENPWSGIGQDRVPERPIRYITNKEFNAIIAGCERTKDPLFWRTLLTVLYTSGCRFGEAVHLAWPDVDFEHDTVRVSAKTETRNTIAWNPKTFEMRTVPLPTETMALLAKMQERSEPGHPYVFISANRIAAIKRLKAEGRWSGLSAVLNNTRRTFLRIVARASKAAPTLVDGEGRSSVCIHDFRRTAITNWSRFANTQTVMRLAGHSRFETTVKHYAATTPDQIDLARRASAAALRQIDSVLPQNPVLGQNGR